MSDGKIRWLMMRQRGSPWVALRYHLVQFFILILRTSLRHPWDQTLQQPHEHQHQHDLPTEKLINWYSPKNRSAILYLKKSQFLLFCPTKMSEKSCFSRQRISGTEDPLGATSWSRSTCGSSWAWDSQGSEPERWPDGTWVVHASGTWWFHDLKGTWIWHINKYHTVLHCMIWYINLFWMKPDDFRMTGTFLLHKQSFNNDVCVPMPRGISRLILGRKLG